MKKLLSKITFTHFLLALIALIMYFGFYYSSNEFRSKVYMLKYRIQYFGYRVDYEKIGETIYKCKYEPIEQLKLDKREVEERYGVVIETKSRFGIPFSKNYFYVANNATNAKNKFKEASNNCVCQKGFNENNICNWISYSEPTELK